MKRWTLVIIGLIAVLGVLSLSLGVDWMSWQAYRSFARGDYGQAAKLYGQLATEHPEDVQQALNCGLAYFMKGEYYRANDEYSRAASLSGASRNAKSQACLGQGNCCYKLEDYPGALAAFKLSLLWDDSNELARHNLQEVQKKLDKPGQQGQQNQDKQGQDKSGQQDQDKQGQDKSGQQNQDKQGQDKSGQQDQDKQGQDKSGQQNQDKQGQGKSGQQNQDKQGQGKSGQQNQDKQGQDKSGQQNQDKQGQDKSGQQDHEKQGQDKSGEQDQDKQGQDKSGQQDQDKQGQGKSGQQNQDKQGQGKSGQQNQDKQGQGKSGQPGADMTPAGQVKQRQGQNPGPVLNSSSERMLRYADEREKQNRRPMTGPVRLRPVRGSETW